MNGSVSLPAWVTEWAWLFGFALVSLALVALAVLADALYEGYRARIRHAREAVREPAEGSVRRSPSPADESGAPGKKAA